MKGKFLSIVGILVLLVALVPAAVYAAPKPIDYKPMDIGPVIRQWEPTQERIINTPADAAAEGFTSSTPYTDCVLATKTFMVLTPSGYGFAAYYLVAESDTSQIWVQANLAWPAGDPRPDGPG